MSEKARILIVDDNVSLCTILSLILGRKGYSVVTAHGGREAIERVRERSFDMILLDIKMPVMDGVQTHRRIKQTRPGSVVMMMTAYAVEDLAQDALQQGAHGILHKPLDMAKTIEVLEEVLEQKKTC